MTQKEYPETEKAKITVFGVGGGGCHAINHMIDSKLYTCDFVSADTDTLVLKASKAEIVLPIGTQLTHRLGSVISPDIGARAVQESQSEIKAVLQHTDIVVIVTYLGGGTGTGALPLIAKYAKDLGVLSIALVARPFNSEGKLRMETVQRVLKDIHTVADCTLIVPNDKLLTTVPKSVSFTEIRAQIETNLQQIVETITSLCNVPGLIGVDFADVKSGLGRSAFVGFGVAAGVKRAVQALEKAIINLEEDGPVLDKSSGVLLRIAGSSELLSLVELEEITTSLFERLTNENAYLVVGGYLDDTLGKSLRVNLIASRDQY